MAEPRRLVLTVAQAAGLAAAAGVALPPGFAADAVAPAASVDGPLAATLAVLAKPTVGVRVEVSGRGVGLRAAYAVSGPLGASLFTLPDERVELSAFPSWTLGRELIRAVPAAPSLPGGQSRVHAALDGDGGTPLAGRVPLAALAHHAHVSRLGGLDTAGVLGLTGEQSRLVARLEEATTGVLSCLTIGRTGGTALAGQVVWLATDRGWVGLRPVPEGRLVDLVPVAREDIGVWLAPGIAEIVGVHSGQS